MVQFTEGEGVNLELIKLALEIGRDAAQEVATHYHEAMRGYRASAHEAKDNDVRTIEDAIASLAEPSMNDRIRADMASSRESFYKTADAVLATRRTGVVPLPEPDMLIECTEVGQQFKIISNDAIINYGHARVYAAIAAIPTPSLQSD